MEKLYHIPPRGLFLPYFCPCCRDDPRKFHRFEKRLLRKFHWMPWWICRLADLLHASNPSNPWKVWMSFLIQRSSWIWASILSNLHDFCWGNPFVAWLKHLSHIPWVVDQLPNLDAHQTMSLVWGTALRNGGDCRSVEISVFGAGSDQQKSCLSSSSEFGCHFLDRFLVGQCILQLFYLFWRMVHDHDLIGGMATRFIDFFWSRPTWGSWATNPCQQWGVEHLHSPNTSEMVKLHLSHPWQQDQEFFTVAVGPRKERTAKARCS